MFDDDAYANCEDYFLLKLKPAAPVHNLPALFHKNFLDIAKIPSETADSEIFLEAIVQIVKSHGTSIVPSMKHRRKFAITL